MEMMEAAAEFGVNAIDKERDRVYGDSEEKCSSGL